MVVLGWITWAFLATILNGFVFSILWKWFMVPTLGLPMIGIVQSIGIATMVGYLTNHNIAKENDDEDKIEKYTRLVVISIFRPLLALLIGYIAHFFM